MYVRARRNNNAAEVHGCRADLGRRDVAGIRSQGEVAAASLVFGFHRKITWTQQ